MGTRDWARAGRKLATFEDPNYGLRQCAQPGCTEMVKGDRCRRHTRTISSAIAAYHDAHPAASQGTKLSRRATLRHLDDFLDGGSVPNVDWVDLEALHPFRGARNVSPRTWTKQLGTVRHFFRFCLDNEWILRNWADKVKMPRNLKPAAREPYEPNEMVRIIAACYAIGRGRALCFCCCGTPRFASRTWRHWRGTASEMVRYSSAQLRMASRFVCPCTPICRLPLMLCHCRAALIIPIAHTLFGAAMAARGQLCATARRTLAAVFAASGVAGACSHRFRHTLATQILEMGGTFEEAPIF